MKVSISNIAWDPAQDSDVADVLKEYGVHGIDIAASKIWPNAPEVSDEEIASWKQFWTERNFSVVGMQSLHFGHPDLLLFGDDDSRKRLFEHTARMVQLAGRIGITAIVIGSPKNRQRGEMPLEQAMDIATTFFRELGPVAESAGTTVCIEPNAKAYGCDFVNTALEGLELVQRIDHVGVRLHLDSGNMTMMQENVVDAIEKCIDVMHHFHVSEPEMGQVGVDTSPVAHADIAAALKRVGYTGWVSIEMKDGLQDNNVDAVRQAVEFVTRVYS